jgi:hypothetical protein
METLSEDLQELLRTLVWSGFYDRERILENLGEAVEGEGEELTVSQQALLVDRELAAKKEAEASWPERTDCDKLDDAFARLEKQKIIALQNAGYTQSDGFGDCYEEYERRGAKKSGVLGFCFYQFQDLQRAVRGSPLDFGFGAIDRQDETAKAVGKAICEALEAQGFVVKWNQSPGTRPRVMNLEWKRRRP